MMMAEPTGLGGKPKPTPARPPVDLSPDEVIDDIVAHFKGLQGVTVLIGYLGDSPKGPTYVRFYPDLSLVTYCDILKTDIVRRERIQRTDDADASKIFVSASTKFRVVKGVETEMEASFLKGQIASSHTTDTGEEVDSNRTKYASTCPRCPQTSSARPCDVC
jgi:hypothetical protein